VSSARRVAAYVAMLAASRSSPAAWRRRPASRPALGPRGFRHVPHSGRQARPPRPRVYLSHASRPAEMWPRRQPPRH
jgi:hypothetical protein